MQKGAITDSTKIPVFQSAKDRKRNQYILFIGRQSSWPQHLAAAILLKAMLNMYINTVICTVESEDGNEDE